MTNSSCGSYRAVEKLCIKTSLSTGSYSQPSVNSFWLAAAFAHNCNDRIVKVHIASAPAAGVHFA